MIGVAQHWYKVLTQVRPSLTWTEFQSELLHCFSGLEIQNPYEQLATIRQSHSIFDYIDDFEYVLSLVPPLPESQTLGYFIAGLKDDVKQQVRLHRPTSCIDAMYLAKDVELMLRPSDSNSLMSRFRYSPQVGLPMLDSGIGHRPLGNRMPTHSGNCRPTSGQASYHDCDPCDHLLQFQYNLHFDFIIPISLNSMVLHTTSYNTIFYDSSLSFTSSSFSNELYKVLMPKPRKFS
ncbi:hypothetical protein E3N88_17026 [Mikania micrantha]|uniref:Retrotransposon gag domain-containing protein n=1 Tax=Mikania micrantha TaxID=192012 RepID=A0A5N6NS65_9ASTR|nr:hypothetical protein E3N88_17026 [Mikania micrantha]